MGSPIDQAVDILKSNQICDRCLGRCFARLGTGLGNDERGRALRVVAEMSTGERFETPSLCPICQNLFETCEQWAAKATKLVQGIEFLTYLMGTHPPAHVVEAERSLHEAHWISAEMSEPFKQEFNRTTGKHFGAIMEQGGLITTVDMSTPDITFKIDLDRDEISVEIRSLFIYGRYRKLVRGIPQTQWPCRECRGRGCDNCNGSGKQYQESVGELIAAPVLEVARAESHAFHGAGREDVDALMLGTGRPFVLEIKKPLTRSLDLCGLKTTINAAAHRKIEVGPLRFVNHKLVEEIKRKKASKSYTARIEFSDAKSQRELDDAIGKLIGEIKQKTPTRVLHRRADLTRRRRLFSMDGELLSSTKASVSLTCDGGLYVKELISGDGGRTEPSLSGLISTSAVVKELDVTSVVGDFPDST